MRAEMTMRTEMKVDPYMTLDQIETVVGGIEGQWRTVLRPADAETLAGKVRSALTAGAFTGLVIASHQELDARLTIGLGLSGRDNVGNQEPFLTERMFIKHDEGRPIPGPVPITEVEKALDNALAVLTYEADPTGQSADVLETVLKPLGDVIRTQMVAAKDRAERLVDRYLESGPTATKALYPEGVGRSIYKTWMEQARAERKDSGVDEIIHDLRTAVFLRRRARNLAHAMRQFNKEIATEGEPSDTIIERVISAKAAPSEKTIKRVMQAKEDDPREAYKPLLDLVRVALATGFDPSLVLGEYFWARALFQAAIVIGAAERGLGPDLTLQPLAAAGLVQLLRIEEPGREPPCDELTRVQAFLAERVPGDLRRTVSTWESKNRGDFPLIRALLGVVPGECFLPT